MIKGQTTVEQVPLPPPRSQCHLSLNLAVQQSVVSDLVMKSLSTQDVEIGSSLPVNWPGWRRVSSSWRWLSGNELPFYCLRDHKLARGRLLPGLSVEGQGWGLTSHMWAGWGD